MNESHYLSDGWFAAASARVAAPSFISSSASPIAFSYAISGVPDWHPRDGELITYRIDIDPDAKSATLTQTDEPGDVRFAMSFDVASDVAHGRISGSRAFLDGSIRLGGDIAALIERAEDLKQLSGFIGAEDA